MPTAAVAGALAAILGSSRRAEYRRLQDEYKRNCERAAAIGATNIVLKNLTSLQNDLGWGMNVEKRPNNEHSDLFVLQLKQKAANDLISKTRLAIAKELDAFMVAQNDLE